MTRTEQALEDELLQLIKKKSFCIVGCGAVGATFAEILVRTGATRIRLIDGEEVDITNLNRMKGFVNDDVDKKKVEVLANYLKEINPAISKPKVVAYHFKNRYPSNENKKEVRCARDLIANSDVIIIAIDKNRYRILCEKYCREHSKDYLSVGIGVDKKKRLAYYECNWKPQTPDDKKDAEGYGPGNGSFASIVLEATAVGFHLMLHCLQNPENSEYTRYEKQYINFYPCEIEKK